MKSASQHLYHIHWSLVKKLCLKKSLLLTCQILGLPVNTFATDENYPVLNRDNLTIPIQMQLSQKHNTFSQFLAAFLKFTLNFKYFGKKSNVRRFCISEIMDCEKVVRSMSKKSRFRRPFEKQHGKRAQTLLKYESHHLYDIYRSLPSQLTWKTRLLLT